MLGYGGLSRSEGRVIRIAHDWETLRAAHGRGEIPDRTYLDQLQVMSDELAGTGASLAHPSLTVARESAVDLRHRIDLHRLSITVRPPVLPGALPQNADNAPELLRELWRRYRRDPVRWPSHPDAVGHPGSDGVPLDGEGGRLTDRFRILWQDVAVTAAADPARPLAEVDALADRGMDILRRYGATPVQVAALRARVLTATGRVGQARELLDLVGDEDPEPGLDVTRAVVALLRGDLDLLDGILRRVVDPEGPQQCPEPSPDAWIMLTAASLVPLAHVCDAATTARRLAGVVGACAGRSDRRPAMLNVVDYLARAGQPETALSLLLRTVGPPTASAALAPALCAITDAGWSSDPARDLGSRRVIDGGPTLRELAAVAVAQRREWTDALDARNGSSLWSSPDPAGGDAGGHAGGHGPHPVPPIGVGDLTGIPGLSGLALPAPLPGGTGQQGRSVELPGVGPVDLDGFDASDAVCATILYSLLGLSAAADCVADRMRRLTVDDGTPDVLEIAAEFVRRADCAAGHGAECFLCGRGVTSGATALLRDVDRFVSDCACAGTAHDAPRRVRNLTRCWSDAHPLVRRLINHDILLAGCLPTRPAVEYAVQGLWSVARILPRSVPLTGGVLLDAVRPETASLDGFGVPVGRGTVDATVVTMITSLVRTLPPPPAVSPLGLVDHVADLADLAEAMVAVGAFHEAAAVTAAGLDAVGGNWARSGALAGEAGADDDGPVRLLRARSAAFSALGNGTAAALTSGLAVTAAEYRGRWRLAEACRLDAASRPAAPGPSCRRSATDS